MTRQRQKDVGRRTWNVKKEADLVFMSTRAQLLRQRHQVIIVHPNDIVRLEDARYVIGEDPVDALIAAEIAVRIFGEIDAIVQDRPEDPIGKAVVIFLIVGVREVDHRICGAVAFDDLRFG